MEQSKLADVADVESMAIANRVKSPSGGKYAMDMLLFVDV